jgi:hypothetical protein
MGSAKNLIRFRRKTIIFFFIIYAAFTGLNRARAQDGPEVFYPPGMGPPELAGPGPETADPGAASGELPEKNAAGTGELPRVFRNIRLGMSLDDLKAALRGDGLYNFRGDRDVSFLPSSARGRGTAGEQSLVETTGSSFIRRAFFQLREGELFIMAFALDTALVDHYSVFTGFVEKYGEPASLDPKEAVWETETTRIAIERPLTVKYIDMRMFNEIIGESALVESGEVRRRQEFLDDF